MLFRFLDSPHIQLDESLEMLPSTKPVALLVYLACQQTWVTRDTLSALFAEENTDSDALRQLRVILSRARKFGWAQALELEDHRLRFEVQTDLQLFRQAIGAADWQRATELYRSDFLSGFQIQASGFEAWLEVERETLRQAWLEAALLYAKSLAVQHDHLAASHLLQNILASDALSEDVLAFYLEQQYLAGGRSEALKAFERFREQLQSELALEPLESTLKLVQLIRQAAPLETTAVSNVSKSSVPLTILRPPQLIGRDAERATLETANQTLMLVSGEPGAGKTRLLEEVLGHTTWLACFEGLENVAYQPLIAFLRSQLSTLPDLGFYREDLARLIPEVLPNASLRTDDPISSKARLLEALARCFEAQDTPIVIDDLQWADPSSLEFFSFLALRGAVKIFGTYRSSEINPALAKVINAWRSNDFLLEIKLEPLTMDDINSLLASLSGLEAGPRRFSSWLSKQSGGNPFFALETLKALFETGMLHEKDGAWTSQLDDISLDYNELRVPSKVAAVIEQRVSRLSEPTKRALQAACVMRQGFTPKTLAGIVGLSEFAVLDALEEAQNSSLIVNDHFVHDLIRQGMYQNLPEARRKILHGNVAQMLENVGEPLVVAEHWLEAGENKRAVDLWVKVIPKLRDLSLYDELIRVCLRILEYSTDQLIHDQARRDLIVAHVDAGHFDEAQSQLEVRLKQTNHPLEAARLLVLQADLFNINGQHRKALETLKGFDPIPTWFDDDMSEDLRWIKSFSYSQLGHYQEALELLEIDHAGYEHEQPSWKLVQSLTAIGSLQDRLENYDKALKFHQQALQMGKAIGSLNGQMNAMRNLLFTLQMLGRSEEGLAPAEELLQFRHVGMSTLLRSNLAATYLKLGRYQEAKTHYEQVLEQSQEPHTRIAALGRISEAYSALGIHERIDETLDTALDELTTTEYPTAQGIVAISVFKYGNDKQVIRIEAFLESFDFEGAQPDIQVLLNEAREARKNRI